MEKAKKFSRGLNPCNETGVTFLYTPETTIHSQKSATAILNNFDYEESFNPFDQYKYHELKSKSESTINDYSKFKL